jgi:hypothetical protein
MLVMLFAIKCRKVLSSGRFPRRVRLTGASRGRVVHEFLGRPVLGAESRPGIRGRQVASPVAGSRGVRTQDVGFLPVVTSNFHAA